MIYRQVAPQILEKIKMANNPLLISHEKPDGDTLGASLALANLLENLNINYKHFCSDQPAAYFNFLPKIENLIWDFKQINLKNHDLIIALDCGDLKRTGISNELLEIKDNATLINIDHHQSNDHYGHYNLVIPNASSTSEIVYNFFNFHKLKIDKYIATNLLTGILTDTMNFTNAATTTESLKIAAELVTAGARLNQIISNINQNKNLDALKLWGDLLSRVEYNFEYNFAYTLITKQDLKDHQLSPDGVDGLASFLSNLQDVDFVMVLTEEENNLIKGSLRTTKDEIDVSKLAQDLGGGGHQKAAGFKLTKPKLDNQADWKNLVIDAIINKLRALKSLI